MDTRIASVPVRPAPAPPWQSDPVAGSSRESEFRLVVIDGESLEDVRAVVKAVRGDGFELVRVVPVEYATGSSSVAAAGRLGLLIKRSVA